MCGILGIVAGQGSHVNQLLYDGLLVLQHRGQDAAGIVTCDGEKLHRRKAGGLVSDVFYKRHMKKLVGHMGIGHVRYPTAGTSSVAEAQPFYVNSPYGITLAHNGNLTNATELRTKIADIGRHLNTSSDSEMLRRRLRTRSLVSIKTSSRDPQSCSIDSLVATDVVKGPGVRSQGSRSVGAIQSAFQQKCDKNPLRHCRA